MALFRKKFKAKVSLGELYGSMQYYKIEWCYYRFSPKWIDLLSYKVSPYYFYGKVVGLWRKDKANEICLKLKSKKDVLDFIESTRVFKKQLND